MDSFSFASLTESQIKTYIAKDILIPLFIATPLFYILLSKIYELSIARQELIQISREDQLTRLLNRRAFFELVTEFERSSAAGSVGLALMIIDVDYFKKINDTFGHQAGDQALKSIADAITSVSPTSSLVARLGGEEFAVVLNSADESEISELAEAIRKSVSDIHFAPNGYPTHLSVSIGVCIGTSRSSFNEIFLSADQKLYESKSKGRNIVTYAMI